MCLEFLLVCAYSIKNQTEFPEIVERFENQNHTHTLTHTHSAHLYSEIIIKFVLCILCYFLYPFLYSFVLVVVVVIVLHRNNPLNSRLYNIEDLHIPLPCTHVIHRTSGEFESRLIVLKLSTWFC